MFSRFLGKGKKSESPPSKNGRNARGLEVIEDDQETGWGLWDSALADLDSKSHVPRVEKAVEIELICHGLSPSRDGLYSLGIGSLLQGRKRIHYFAAIEKERRPAMRWEIQSAPGLLASFYFERLVPRW